MFHRALCNTLCSSLIPTTNYILSSVPGKRVHLQCREWEVSVSINCALGEVVMWFNQMIKFIQGSHSIRIFKFICPSELHRETMPEDSSALRSYDISGTYTIRSNHAVLFYSVDSAMYVACDI